MKYVLMILLTTFSNVVWGDEGVDISDPAQVAELHKVQDKLDSVSTAIVSCMDTGEDHKTCLCKHKELIIDFNSIVENLFSNQPELDALDIVRFKAFDGTWISQSLVGIKKQARKVLLCN